MSVTRALETVELAASLRDRGVVGVDLSGNPTIGEVSSTKRISVRMFSRGRNLDAFAGVNFPNRPRGERPGRVEHTLRQRVHRTNDQILCSLRGYLNLRRSNGVSAGIPLS